MGATPLNAINYQSEGGHAPTLAVVDFEYDPSGGPPPSAVDFESVDTYAPVLFSVDYSYEGGVYPWALNFVALEGYAPDLSSVDYSYTTAADEGSSSIDAASALSAAVDFIASGSKALSAQAQVVCTGYLSAAGTMSVDIVSNFTADATLTSVPVKDAYDPERLRADRVRTYAAFEAAPMLKWRGG